MTGKVIMLQRTWFGDNPSDAVIGYHSGIHGLAQHLQIFKIGDNHVGYMLTTAHDDGHVEYHRGWIHVGYSSRHTSRTEIVKSYLRNRHGITIAFIEYPFGIDEEGELDHATV